MNSNDDNKMRYLTFQVTSGAITRDPGAIFSNTALPNKYNLGGAYIGNADFGAKRFVIALKGSSQTVWSGTPGSATRQTNEEWTRPFNIMGLHWDGTRFWSFSDNGDIGKHSTNKAPAGRNTVPIQARHTWFDGNGTTHETDGGPIETHDLGNRQWLRVESAPAPDTGGDPLDTEKADQIRVYISSDGVTTPRLQTADGWAAVTPNPTAWKPKVRNVTVATTSGSNQITAAAVDTFVPDDQTGAITGTGIPAGTTITSVDANGKVATLSANATASGSITATVTPAIATRSGVFESINNSNSAPPAVNGFATVGRAPGAYKSTRTDANGPLINFKGDGSGRVGPWQFDNSGKTLNDFGAERPGTIFMWPSTSTPLDCISCQGQAVKRPTMVGGNGAAGNALANNAAADVAPYIRIWQLFGTTFGSGDGSTTFNVPDMRDRFPSGAGTTRALASTGGSDTVTMPDHNHFAGTYSVGTPSGGVTRGTGSSDTAGPSHSHGFSGQSGTVVGANPPINNVPKFLGLNFVMKL
jgi:microcystin-dependent protein